MARAHVYAKQLPYTFSQVDQQYSAVQYQAYLAAHELCHERLACDFELFWCLCNQSMGCQEIPESLETLDSELD